MSPLAFGLLFILAAGIINPPYALPLKYTPKWSMENVWTMFSFWGMLVFPFVIALITVPHLLHVLAVTPFKPMAIAFTFGIIWGTSNILNGVGIDLIGITLAGPLCAGISLTMATIVPICKRNVHDLATPYGALVICGLIMIISAIVLLAYAGSLRDTLVRSRLGTQSSGVTPPLPVMELESPVLHTAPLAVRHISRGLFVVGLVINMLAGFFDPFLNYAFLYGDVIKNNAIDAGASVFSAPDAVLAVVLPGSLLINVIYCVVMFVSKRSFHKFGAKGTTSYWWMTFGMGLVWMLSITFWGHGSAMLGSAAALGFAIFYGVGLFVNTCLGVGIGEWRSAKGKPANIMLGAISMMILSECLFAYATRIAPK